jgi:hypothetical protein
VVVGIGEGWGADRQARPWLQYLGLNRFKPVKSISKGIQTVLNNFKSMQTSTDSKRIFPSSNNFFHRNLFIFEMDFKLKFGEVKVCL